MPGDSAVFPGHETTPPGTRELLTPGQVWEYDRLRGYAGGHGQDGHKGLR